MYLRYLRIIDRESDKLELKLRHSMQNRKNPHAAGTEQDIGLLHHIPQIEREIVMEKLTTPPRLKQYPEDEDLLDDATTESKQAIEMANISTAAFSPT